MENAIWNGRTLVACEVAEDYEEEKEVRKASYSGELRCPDEGCLSPILKYCHGEIREPYLLIGIMQNAIMCCLRKMQVYSMV